MCCCILAAPSPTNRLSVGRVRGLGATHDPEFHCALQSLPPWPTGNRSQPSGAIVCQPVSAFLPTSHVPFSVGQDDARNDRGRMLKAPDVGSGTLPVGDGIKSTDWKAVTFPRNHAPRLVSDALRPVVECPAHFHRPPRDDTPEADRPRNGAGRLARLDPGPVRSDTAGEASGLPTGFLGPSGRPEG